MARLADLGATEMATRITKVLGGLGAGLAIVVAGAGGIAYFTSERASVADGQISQQGSASSPAPAPTAAEPTAPRSLENLSVNVKPETKMVIVSEHWMIRSGAKVEDFPLEERQVSALSCLKKDYPSTKAFEDCLGSTPGCTPGQREWLSHNGILAKEGLFVYDGKLRLGNATLTNTSTSAQSISFKDIRLEAEVSPFPDAGFSIVCSNYNDWAGGATAGFANAREVLLPTGNETAVFGAPSYYGEDLTRNIPAGMPAVFNLAAGETSNVQLAVTLPDRAGTIAGQVVATVSAADGEREIVVPLPLLDGGTSAYTNVGRPVLSVDGGTVCPDKTSNTKYTNLQRACSFAQLKAEANIG